jgi:NAD(P)-dependent dehydrogenase (short-subunit alcohol dehydrogenase family)
MTNLLNNATALITGGMVGIGRAAAFAFAPDSTGILTKAA